MDGSKIGLVLGAGGITGSAFESATLAALRSGTGWSPQEASVLVGTSAGAWLAAFIAHGYEPEEFIEPREAPGGGVAVALREFMRSPTGLFRPNVMPNYWDPRTYLVPLAPFSTWGMQRFMRRWLPGDGRSWPERDLRIIAYDLLRRERATLDATEGLYLSHAVAASSAIPMMFQPVPHEDRLLVDGGVWSTTNLDVVSDTDLQLLLCLAPLAIRPADRVWGGSPFAGYLDRVADAAIDSLEAEVDTLAASRPQADVLVIRPNGLEAELMGSQPLNVYGFERLAADIHDLALAKFRDSGVKELLARHRRD